MKVINFLKAPKTNDPIINEKVNSPAEISNTTAENNNPPAENSNPAVLISNPSIENQYLKYLSDKVCGQNPAKKIFSQILNFYKAEKFYIPQI